MGTWTPGPGPTDGDDTYLADASGGVASAGAGNDTFLVVAGLAPGVHVFDGGEGFDQAVWDSGGFATDLTLSLSISGPQAVGEGTYQFISIEALTGGGGNDTLTGNAGNNNLWGQDGNDVLYGLDGDDNLSGGRGDDILDGGEGYDSAHYDGNAADYQVIIDGDTVYVSSVNHGNDTLRGIERLVFNDSILDLTTSSGQPGIVSTYWTLTSLSFNRSSEFPANPEWRSPHPNNLQVYDIDNDGNLDVVLLYSHIPPLDDGGVPIRVLLGDGSGNFTDGTAALFGSQTPRTDAQTGVHTNDFNGDGRLDLFISQHGFDAPPWPGLQNRLILSSGQSGVIDATASLPQASDFTHWSSSADIDGDGDIDIYVGNLGNDDYHLTSPYFLINDGNGGFTRSDTRLPSLIDGGLQQFSSSLFFDADNDGDQDLLLGAYADAGSPTSVVLFNDGSGHFTERPGSSLPPPASHLDPAALGVLGMGATDLNNDGFLDLLLLTADYTDRYIQVLINRGDGTFVDETSVRLDAADTSIGREFFLLDINGDGFTDLFLSTGGETRFFLNDGEGRFVALPGSFLGPATGMHFAPGDFNGDGHLDLFISVGVQNHTDPAAGSEPQWIEQHYVALWTPPTSTTQTGNRDANALLGTEAADVIYGLGGDDVIFGAQGDDTLVGGPGADYLNGGEGDDVFIVATGDFDSGEIIYGGSGMDTLRTIGPNVDYRVGSIFSIERMTFQQLAGEATITAVINASQIGAGFASNLVVSGSAAQDAVQIFVGLNQTVNTSAWTFDFPNWSFEDYLVYVGDAGDETFIGFPGLDVFFGSPGNDIYDGRGAFDFAAYIFSPNAVTMDLAITGPQAPGGNQGFDTLINIEGLAGSQLDDVLYGDHQDNILMGMHGNDVLIGRGGNDDIRGYEGSDIIEGGMGADILWGGAEVFDGVDGADTFRYRNAAEGGDTIMDFQAGIDRIEVSAAGFGGGLVAGQAVTLVANGAPVASGGGGQFLYNTANGQLYWDADGAGAGAAVLIATLRGTPTLTAASFVVSAISGVSLLSGDVDGPMAALPADKAADVMETLPPGFMADADDSFSFDLVGLTGGLTGGLAGDKGGAAMEVLPPDGAGYLMGELFSDAAAGLNDAGLNAGGLNTGEGAASAHLLADLLITDVFMFEAHANDDMLRLLGQDVMAG